MLDLGTTKSTESAVTATGEFVTLAGERYYAIYNVDAMPPFFISVVSDADHWMFVSSTGGLTAGRVSPETALFPYVPVDKVYESTPHTGPKTLIRVTVDGAKRLWEPFNQEQDDRYEVSRNLYKSVAGNKLRFEEVNHDLQIAFRYTWATSDAFGFVRQCELHNLGKQDISVDVLDGLQNLLPASTPSASQANASNLVDAYKWTELDEATGLATYTLYSRISDRAEPSESLRANTVFSLGLEQPSVLISSPRLRDFRAGRPLRTETHTRGTRGAYFVNATLELGPKERRAWQFVADVEQSQSRVVTLLDCLRDPGQVARKLTSSIATGSDELARIMAATDALQTATEETVVAHHYANVLYNNLRGGIFDDQDNVSANDFARSVRHFSRSTHKAHREFLDGLPDTVDAATLLEHVRRQNDRTLERLCYEYLPIRFGRRHGDPSRPWNKFSIRLKDSHNDRLFSYEGNWRDIFQNWEALSFSYPEFIDNIIAKFVNASTVDGYNPYRISNEGIDWEVEEPDDPWSYIGYWGDHQIIYLLKFLELSDQFHPTRLVGLLRKPIFSYANVPYRIRPFDGLLRNPKSTLRFDHELAALIERRVGENGADGKLVLDAEDNVYHVNLLEKLLVPLLAKLSNFVIGGGIWLNTQRPEWNDANNALVGHGLSMVTLYYMRRYASFLRRLIDQDTESFEMSVEVSRWLEETASALRVARTYMEAGSVSPAQRYDLLASLGSAASRYRQKVYCDVPFAGKQQQSLGPVKELLDDALAAIDHSICTNRRNDGLYHAYNLIEVKDNTVSVDNLYKMLEGQVAALSAGTISTDEACEMLQALFDSDMYRADQRSFMLYPDRQLSDFLDKNRIDSDDIEGIALVEHMLAAGDARLVLRDAEGTYRFHADFANADDLNRRLDTLIEDYGDQVGADREALEAVYEKVFNHRAFTGRSGGMFGFEGLGCIYWHMVSKLLLAIQENVFAAVDSGADKSSRDRLGQYYYRVREGIGFNKTPVEYGAFPTDPYSHTPKHSGAQQPGMTGQVKEEVLSRFGELGVRVMKGAVHFQPALLRRREFIEESQEFCYLDIQGSWDHVAVPANGLAFTWCQVPVIYRLNDNDEPAVTVTRTGGEVRHTDGLILPAEECAELFSRTGRIEKIEVTLRPDLLFDND